MKNLTEAYIKNYITKKYGIMRHDKRAFNLACKETAKIAKCKPLEIFHFIIENKDFNGFCNSYGFNTSYGRQVKRDFENNYYKYNQ